jgi:signal transduction histidine kinase
MTSVGMLAAGTAHEIATPLGAVVANLEHVRWALERASCAAASSGGEVRDALTQALSEGAAAISDAIAGAQHAAAVLRDLRAFARPAEETRVVIELRAAVDRAIRLATPELSHRARVVTEFQDAPPVLGSESLLTQVFVDLLVNAAQALTNSPRTDNLIAVGVWGAAGETIAEVRDTGPGIPETLLARIFEPFFTTKPADVGTGLGLWICRQIVSAHGGRIDVESSPDCGTRVRVRLPAHVHSAAQPRSLVGRRGDETNTTPP